MGTRADADGTGVKKWVASRIPGLAIRLGCEDLLVALSIGCV